MLDARSRPQVPRAGRPVRPGDLAPPRAGRSPACRAAACTGTPGRVGGAQSCSTSAPSALGSLCSLPRAGRPRLGAHPLGCAPAQPSADWAFGSAPYFRGCGKGYVFLERIRPLSWLCPACLRVLAAPSPDFSSPAWSPGRLSVACLSRGLSPHCSPSSVPWGDWKAGLSCWLFPRVTLSFPDLTRLSRFSPLFLVNIYLTARAKGLGLCSSFCSCRGHAPCREAPVHMSSAERPLHLSPAHVLC